MIFRAARANPSDVSPLQISIGRCPNPWNSLDYYRKFGIGLLAGEIGDRSTGTMDLNETGDFEYLSNRFSTRNLTRWGAWDSKGILNFWWIEEARRERRIKYQVKGGIIKGIGIVLNGENIEDLSKWNYFKFLIDEIVGSKMWYKIEWIEGRVVRRNSCMFLICDTLYFKPLRIDLQLFRVFPFYQTISPLIRHFHMSGK